VDPGNAPSTFYGELRGQHQVAGFTLTDSRYAAGLHIPRHAHACAYFCLVLRGAYTESCGGSSQVYGPLAVVFHPEGEVHADQFHADGGRVFNVTVPRPWADRVREFAPLLERRASFQGGTLAWLAGRLYREFQQPDALSPLVVEGLVLEILGRAARQSVHPGDSAVPRWLRQAAELLRARFRENVPLAEVARSAGVHPAHLARMFRSYLHCSVGEYVRRLRVEHACGALLRSSLPLVEIALEAGFCDHSHFSTVFKRHTGVTPTEYRQLFRVR
jgi:AraC family transcriptional regulator